MINQFVDQISNELEEINFSGIVNISGTGEATLTKYLSSIVKEFGDRNIHIEIVTNGDKLKPKMIESLYDSGLQQLVVSMYDGPEQIKHFTKLFDDSGIDNSKYILRDRWYKEDEEYGLILTNRAGTFSWNKKLGFRKRSKFF